MSHIHLSNFYFVQSSSIRISCFFGIFCINLLLVIQPIYANEVSLKEEELGALRQHISRVQQAIESVRGKLDLQQEKLRNSERDINHIVRRLRQVGQSLETKKQRLKHLKTKK